VLTALLPLSESVSRCYSFQKSIIGCSRKQDGN
jgi:hypothetical protein